MTVTTRRSSLVSPSAPIEEPHARQNRAAGGFS
jgi:hypothetical protein